MHTCRGNFKSAWVAEGGYDPVAEAMFSSGVDAFFMEFDAARAGGFEPLRYLPKGKKVVLGLVSSKTGSLEEKGRHQAENREAAKFVPPENLGLSPAVRLLEHAPWQRPHPRRAVAQARAGRADRPRSLVMEVG